MRDKGGSGGPLRPQETEIRRQKTEDRRIGSRRKEKGGRRKGDWARQGRIRTIESMLLAPTSYLLPPTSYLLLPACCLLLACSWIKRSRPLRRLLRGGHPARPPRADAGVRLPASGSGADRCRSRAPCS